jgi:hypothetical protein
MSREERALCNLQLPGHWEDRPIIELPARCAPGFVERGFCWVELDAGFGGGFIPLRPLLESRVIFESIDRRWKVGELPEMTLGGESPAGMPVWPGPGGYTELLGQPLSSVLGSAPQWVDAEKPSLVAVFISPQSGLGLVHVSMPQTVHSDANARRGRSDYLCVCVRYGQRDKAMAFEGDLMQRRTVDNLEPEEKQALADLLNCKIEGILVTRNLRTNFVPDEPPGE